MVRSAADEATNMRISIGIMLLGGAIAISACDVAGFGRVVKGILASYDDSQNGIIRLNATAPGNPTRDETVRFDEEHGEVVTMIDYFLDSDTNGDDLISRRELKRGFRPFDANKDGTLSDAERVSFDTVYPE